VPQESAVLFALLLGLMGSLGHCVGMCGPVVALFTHRAQGTAPTGTSPLSGNTLLLHAGRVAMYATLGWVAGTLGGIAETTFPGLRWAQGVLALAVAAMAVYMAVALLGRAPSPEVYLAGLTRRWSRVVQRLTAVDRRRSTLLLGLLWGLLPCGLVMTALLAAAASSTPWGGALTMLAFGLGTWPALLALGWLTGRGIARTRLRTRQVAALVVFLFSTQMALRGLAAWGWVGHLQVGGVMLW